MNFSYTPYSLPLIAAAALSIFVAFYAWRHRSATGASALTLLAVALAQWIIGYIMEISSADLGTMYIWGVSQYLGIAFAPYAWLMFAIDFAGYSKVLTRRFYVWTAIFPVVTIILAWTTRWHGLIWANYDISTIEGFSALSTQKGLWFFAHTAYSYLMLLIGTVLLARALLRLQGLYRGQVVAMLVAVFAPWVGNILYLTGYSPIPYLDLTPFSFAVTVVALAWAIFGFHLVDVTPVARDLVIDSLQEGMVVFDSRGRIADMNPSAARIFGVQISHVIGFPAANIFTPWQILLERLNEDQDWVEEFSIGVGQAKRQYEAAVSHIQDAQARNVGRVMIVRELLSSAIRQKPASRPLVPDSVSETVAAPVDLPQWLNSYPWLKAIFVYFYTPIKTDLVIPPNISPLWFRARERSFTIILRIGALIGTIAYVFTLPVMRPESRFSVTSLFFGIILIFLWFLGSVRKVEFEVRANLFLVLIYLMAVNETTSYGYSVESFLFFTAFVTIATLLTGRRGIQIASVSSFVTLLFFAWFIGEDIFIPLNLTAANVRPQTLAMGLTSLFVFLATSSAIANATVVLMENLNSAWQKESQVSNLLQQERDLLEQRVEERTHDLQEAESKFRTLVEQLPAVLYRDDADTGGKNNYYSPQVEKMLGYPMSSWEGDSMLWHQILHPEDRENVIATITETLDAGYSMSEYRLLNADGRVVWVRDEALLVRDPDGKPLFVQGIMQDITEIKKAEDQIRKLSRAVEQSGNSIIVTDTNGDIEYVNPTFEKITGYSFEEIKGKNPRILKSGSQRLEFYEKLWDTISSGNVWHGAFHNKRKDGSLYWENATIAPVMDHTGKVTNYVAIKEDVTSRREAEEQLRKLSQAVEQSANTIIIMDRDGRIEYVNPTFSAITGYSSDEAIGKTPESLMNPLATPGRFREQEWWLTVNAGATWRGEFRNYRKDGSVFWESASIAPVFSADGVVTNFIEIKQDVTEQTLLRDQLQRRNEYLSVLHEITLDLLDRRDLDGLLQVVVDRSSALLDAPFSELMLEEDGDLVVKAFTANQPNLKGDRVKRGQAILSWRAFDEKEPVVLEDYATWEHRRDVYDPNPTHATADFPVMAGSRCLGVLALGRDRAGHTFNAEEIQTGILFARLVALVLDNINLYESAVREIDERKRAEALLQESEILFRQIVENASDIIYRTDLKGMFTYANPAALNMMGFKDEREVVGKNYLDLTTPEARSRLKRTYDRQFLGKINNTYYEFPAITMNGEIIWVGQNVQLIMDGDKIVGFQALARNITQLRQAQEALLLARDQALEASRFKSQLVSRVSHELRTPLGGILGFAELLQHEAFGTLNENQQQAVLNIVESTNYLTNTVNDLLDQARIESKSISLHNTHFKPSALLERVATTMSVLAAKKGLEFHAEVAPEFPPELYADETRLQQIIVNLAGNAIKFTAKGGVHLRFTKPGANRWSLVVSDTGVGIPEEERKNIFEPFQQLSNSITRENRGSGLGLAIVKQLVELMGGMISLQSEVGHGSTFTVSFPLNPAPEGQPK